MLSGDEAKTFKGGAEKIARYPFPPFPEGWFAIAWAADIHAGKIYQQRFCGKDLIILRNNLGEMKVFDAYCPHLGAHLGYGGVIDGEFIRCPFHGWKFDSEGRCAEIPFTDRPMKASLKSWPTEVIDGMVMVWNAKHNSEPNWRVDSIHSDEWTDPQVDESCNWVLKVHVQEVCENGIDAAHFPFVHKMKGPIMPPEVEFIGPRAKWKTDTQINGEGIGFNGLINSTTSVSLQGLGLQQVTTNVMDLNSSWRSYIHLSPIDEDNIFIRMAISIKKDSTALQKKVTLQRWIALLAAEISSDFDIWENKKYYSNPLISRADGPLHAFREWAKRFYMLSSD